MKIFLITVPLLLILVHCALAEVTLERPAYAIVLSNGIKLKVAEYQINVELDTITYRSDYSGLTATFPLERVKNIVCFDPTLANVPETAEVIYKNELSIQDFPDDGGIPVTFKVKATSISSSESGYSSGKSTNSGTSGSRSSSSGSSSKGTSSSSSNKFGQSTSRTSKPAASTPSSSSSSSSSQSSSSNSNSSFQDFMNAIAGGNK